MVGSISQVGESRCWTEEQVDATRIIFVLMLLDPSRAPRLTLGPLHVTVPRHTCITLEAIAHCMYIQSHMVHGTQPKRHLHASFYGICRQAGGPPAVQHCFQNPTQQIHWESTNKSIAVVGFGV